MLVHISCWLHLTRNYKEKVSPESAVIVSKVAVKENRQRSGIWGFVEVEM